MGVEHVVVGSSIGCVIRERHIGVDVITLPYGPTEILTPIGVVAATDITNGATIVSSAQERLTEAGVSVELAALTAVANHQTATPHIGHRADIVVTQSWRSPSLIVSVGGVVDKSRTLVALGSKRLVLRVAHHGDVGGVGVAAGVVLIFGDVLIAIERVASEDSLVVAVDVALSGIVHRGVGTGESQVASIAAIDTSDEDRLI